MYGRGGLVARRLLRVRLRVRLGARPGEGEA